MKKLILLLTAMLATSMGLLAQGTSWQNATLINSGETKTGTLDNVTTEVWYKINVTQEGHVDFEATATGTLKFGTSNCQFYGFKNGSTYSRGYFSGSDNYVNYITYHAIDAGQGTYYIKIWRGGGTGTYTLKYTFTPCPYSNDPEPNNNYQNSSLLQSGATVQGRLGYRTSDDVTDTYDWYKIVVPEEGKVEFKAIASETLKFGTSNSQFYGFKDGNTYSRGYFSGSDNYVDTITYQATDVGKGTYYIAIWRGGGSGGYSLYYKFTPCPQAADPEPNNDYEHSSLLESGETVQGRLGYRASDNVTDTYDWYKIVVPEEGKVEFKAIASETLKFGTSNSQFYGFKDGNTYSRGYFSGSDNYVDTITYQATDVGKGTYYIAIWRGGGNGGYSLYYKFTPCPLAADPEPNNDYEQASWLKSGRIAQGRLGYRASDNVIDTYDWYRIKVTKTGPVEIIVTPTENLTFMTSSTSINVIKNNSLYTVSQFHAQSTGSTTLVCQINELEEGTYYVRISRNGGSGGYRITYNGPALTGDVDGDNRLTINDVTDMISYLLGYNNPSFAIGDADVDGDGRISISDVTELIYLLLTAN